MNQKRKLIRRTDECLYFMLRGKTAREIAKMMHLSIRTVQKYFYFLKISFDCATKSQLIEKAVTEGYINYIPKRLLNTQINNLRSCDDSDN